MSGLYGKRRYYLMVVVALAAILFAVSKYRPIQISISLYSLFFIIAIFVYAIHWKILKAKNKVLQKKINELETVHEIVKIFDTFPDMDSAFKQITRISALGTEVSGCAVYLFDAQKEILEQKSFFSQTKDMNVSKRQKEFCSHAFETGKTIFRSKSYQEGLWDLIWRNSEPSGGTVACPLVHKGQRMGVMLFFSTKPISESSWQGQSIKIVTSAVAMMVSDGLYHQSLVVSSQTDGLTRLYNRTYFFDMLDREIQKSKMTGRSVFVLILDIDKFKRVNDHHGHLMGDEVLKKVGHIIRENTRNSDIAARYGGEEFAIIVPQGSYTVAEQMADRICLAVESYTKNYTELEQKQKVTLSVGIACYPRCGQTPEEVVNMADKRMYTVKRAGGNRYLYE